MHRELKLKTPIFLSNLPYEAKANTTPGSRHHQATHGVRHSARTATEHYINMQPQTHATTALAPQPAALLYWQSSNN